MDNITENNNIDSNKTEDFDLHDPFEEAEQCLKIKLPEGLKKIFIFNGFNNKYILSKLEETEILDTETFARELLPDLI
ncbi:unnamed protein product [Macrosiphum euphorbiae]|uniref:Uncharacterized protein n=1 Tax=Macrosiphum euphorbiae TaxID=13131 RepID=A0AAV0XYA1_9HEMI|nr:unnamed protein product [Macrosiphum euphorbiae]